MTRIAISRINWIKPHSVPSGIKSSKGYRRRGLEFDQGTELFVPLMTVFGPARLLDLVYNAATYSVILHIPIVINMSSKVQPYEVFCIYLIHSFVNMYLYFRKAFSAMATVSGHFTFFRDENIKFQYNYLQSSKFPKYCRAQQQSGVMWPME